MAKKALLISCEEMMIVLRRNVYAREHQHHALQLTFGIDNPFRASVNQKEKQYTAILIAADTSHLVHGQSGWVVTCLINPESAIARAINQYLGQRTHIAIEQNLSIVHKGLFNRLIAGENHCAGIKDFVAAIPGIINYSPQESALDERIKDALAIIDTVEDKKIPASDLADDIALSESRFRHLFKDEIGIPLRRYLLWQRLINALEIICEGKDFTRAAHEASFTDSAHLSRTFQQMFGIAPSALFTPVQHFRFISCS